MNYGVPTERTQAMVECKTNLTEEQDVFPDSEFGEKHAVLRTQSQTVPDLVHAVTDVVAVNERRAPRRRIHSYIEIRFQLMHVQ